MLDDNRLVIIKIQLTIDNKTLSKLRIWFVFLQVLRNKD